MVDFKSDGSARIGESIKKRYAADIIPTCNDYATENIKRVYIRTIIHKDRTLDTEREVRNMPDATDEKYQQMV